MNKYLCLITGLLLITAQKAYCIMDEIGSTDLGQSLKAPSSEPNMLTIFFALLFVIGLIYITGIIYSKLNVVGAKAVQEQLKNAELNRAVILSTTQLGQGKNLHVIELNGRRYLIGATANSINLIKEIEVKDEVKKDSEEPKKQDDVEIDKAIKFLYGSAREEIIDVEEPVKEEFDIHKKYL